MLNNNKENLKQCDAFAWPFSWKEKDIQSVVSALEKLPALIHAQQIEDLSVRLIDVAQQKSFFIQAGDCAENLDECDRATIAEKMALLWAMAEKIPSHYTPLLIGRIAGQYAKPRSAAFETRDNVTLPAYHGDLVNRSEFTLESRTPDPTLMLQAYDASKKVLLHIDHITQKKYTQPLYTSHEVLMLPYEIALTREHYNTATHFPWLGMRTALQSDIHVNYLASIRNPIGIKLGPLMTAERLLALLDKLNPDNKPGRITLIYRLGATIIDSILPAWITRLQHEGKNVIWCCDPMHGNTEITSTGIKTRRVANIIAEIRQACAIHQQTGTFLGGIHLEVTPDNVTECIDDEIVFENQLTHHYKSKVDPRLNAHQALAVMDAIVCR